MRHFLARIRKEDDGFTVVFTLMYALFVAFILVGMSGNLIWHRHASGNEKSFSRAHQLKKAAQDSAMFEMHSTDGSASHSYKNESIYNPYRPASSAERTINVGGERTADYNWSRVSPTQDGQVDNRIIKCETPANDPGEVSPKQWARYTLRFNGVVDQNSAARTATQTNISGCSNVLGIEGRLILDRNDEGSDFYGSVAGSPRSMRGFALWGTNGVVVDSNSGTTDFAVDGHLGTSGTMSLRETEVTGERMLFAYRGTRAGLMQGRGCIGDCEGITPMMRPLRMDQLVPATVSGLEAKVPLQRFRPDDVTCPDGSAGRYCDMQPQSISPCYTTNSAGQAVPREDDLNVGSGGFTLNVSDRNPVLCFRNININGPLRINAPATGTARQVAIVARGRLTIGSAGSISRSGTMPHFYVNGDSVTISNAGDMRGYLFAPKALCSINANGAWLGGIACDYVRVSGSSNMRVTSPVAPDETPDDIMSKVCLRDTSVTAPGASVHPDACEQHSAKELYRMVWFVESKEATD